MVRFDLTGKTALVTGSASGIGLATVKLLASSGCRVAVNYLPSDTRGPEQIARLSAEGADVVAAPGDVGDPESCRMMVEGAVANLQGLDYLVNNAGTPGTRSLIRPDDFSRLTEDLWANLVQVNLLGVFRCAKHAAPSIRARGGAVVNLASVAGMDSAGSSMAYGATKAGVISLTKNLARAYAPSARVNAIAPGAVDSDWMVEWTEERRQASADKALLKRRCQPNDLAEVIVYLLAGATMVTGQTVVVDGGLTLETR